jgi:predicted amidohydrolase
MSELHVSFIQTNLHWENPVANLKMFDEKVDSIPEGTDLIILPEMFSTGFSMAPSRLAETESGTSVSWLQSVAKRKNCVVTGSLIISENENYYNRLFWVKPDGSFKTYDKRHLFSLAGEENFYSPGKNRLIVDLKGFKIMPLICYDLRFPVWSRNDLNYDVLLYVANWPERRAYFWKQLLIARAIENQSYVIGVNRVGNDGNNIFHSGDSTCLDPLGESIAAAKHSIEEIINVVIYKDKIKEVRDRFMFLNDKDDFVLTI